MGDEGDDKEDNEDESEGDEEEEGALTILSQEKMLLLGLAVKILSKKQTNLQVFLEATIEMALKI